MGLTTSAPGDSLDVADLVTLLSQIIRKMDPGCVDQETWRKVGALSKGIEDTVRQRRKAQCEILERLL